MITNVHELHCGTFCPIHSTSYFPTETMSCRCLLIESSEGLILCDTGLPNPETAPALAQIKFKALHVKNDRSQHCVEQIKKLGFNPNDVRHILLTHLDLDHAGGIIDFPQATIHLHIDEAQYFQHVPFKLKLRYLSEYLPKHAKIQPYDYFGENWNGFQCARALNGLHDEILYVPLQGHTAGHSGIAIYYQGRWLLHCGDAFYFKDDLVSSTAEKNLASEALQTALAVDNQKRIRTANQIALLKSTHPNIKITNSHDPRLSIYG